MNGRHSLELPCSYSHIMKTGGGTIPSKDKWNNILDNNQFSAITGIYLRKKTIFQPENNNLFPVKEIQQRIDEIKTESIQRIQEVPLLEVKQRTII